MPALDLCSLTGPAAKASADDLAGVADGHSGKTSSGDDFSQMMDQALTSGGGKKSAPNNSLAARKNGAAPRTASATGTVSSATNSASETTPADAATATPVDPGSTKKDKPTEKTSVTTKDQPATGSETSASPTVPTSLETLPVFLRLSFDAAVSAKAATAMTQNTGATTCQATDALASLTGAPQKNTTATASAALPVSAGLILPATMNSAFAAAATLGNQKAETVTANITNQPSATEPAAASGAWLKDLKPVTDASVTAADKLALSQLVAGMPATKTTPEPAMEANPAATAPTPTAEASIPSDLLLENGKASLRASLGASEAENAGTGVALSNSPMKKNENTNKVAGLDVKVLPGTVSELAREKNLPTRLVVAPVTTTENRSNDLNLNLPAGNPPVAASTGSLNTVDLPSPGDARLRAVERTQEMVSLHAMRLVESKSDSLQVTIKPAVGTELSLELKQRNGVIEAQVTLHRGDHAFLSAHWPELQQRLEQRGVKLSELGGEANFTGGNSDDTQRPHTPEEEAMQASAFAEFATAGGMGGATARHATDYDGWESWA